MTAAIGQALEEEDDFNSLLRALYGDAQTKEKLRESLMESMDLEAYAVLLREHDGVYRLDTLMDIRSELMAPFAESRLLPIGTGLLPWELSKADEFNLLTGESMRRRPGARHTGEGEEAMISTLVEQVVHCKVLRVMRPLPKEGMEHDTMPRHPYKVLCKLENGLTGVLMEQQFADSDEEKMRFQMSIREDMTISCVITEVYLKPETRDSNAYNLNKASC